MKKTILFFLLLITSYLLLPVSYLYAGWPINRTPGIEGRITDATTGEPIENVVVVAKWSKETMGLEMQSKTYATEIIITDKEGKYVIPAKVNLFFPLLPISAFENLNVIILHPLYDTKPAPMYYFERYGKKKWVYNPEGEWKDGKIIYDVKLNKAGGVNHNTGYMYIAKIEGWDFKNVYPDWDDYVYKINNNLIEIHPAALDRIKEIISLSKEKIKEKYKIKNFDFQY